MPERGRLAAAWPPRHERTSRSHAVLLLVVGAVTVAALAPAAVMPAHAGEVRDLDGPLRFEVADDGRLEVDRARRYLDTLELRIGGSGTMLINELGMDDYVAGIAEMPPDWPMEALKAQAVAARTYGWYVMGSNVYEGYDICATVSCQVFRGAEVVTGSSSGDRWRTAVDETSGEVLLDETGAPVLARYFSTSGGRTYANEEVFPSSGAHAHLVSIQDPYDEVSPYHTWTVRFSREEFDALAARGDRLSTVAPIEDVERLGDVDDPRAIIRVTGTSGDTIEIGTGELRDFLSQVAPDHYPGRFPPLRDDGLRPLPSTVPTARYDVEVTDDEVVLHGQGWGHGVGMGQYGARARAAEGADYLDILAAYYNGLRPTETDAVPDRVRVGLSTQERLTIGADGPMRISAGGQEIEAAALGTWEVVRDADGWQLSAPDGHLDPLDVSATTQRESVVAADDAITVEAEVNKPVRLTMEVRDGDGELVLDRDLGVVEAGDHTAVWRLEDAQGSLVPSGSYRIGLIGEDHAGERDGAAVEITLPLAPDDPPSADGSDAAPARDLVRLAAVVVALSALALAAILVTRRSR